MSLWEELRQDCLSCQGCELCKARTNVVFGVGPTDAKILFVGEGPGAQEDLQGEPFVGAAGKLLDDMLSIIDLGRDNCYIANIVKCRPPQNRDPKPEEQDACIDFLYRQIALLEPKIIVCLGRIAAMRMIREDYRITREHGTWVNKDGVWYTALYHPAALLRDASKRPETFSDLLSLRKKVQEVF
ncbi:MAG: uracil-DNA glycosylase [Clostridia bacterium]|nr:uracil-DNA glycosylase [Clostridia bacterium]